MDGPSKTWVITKTVPVKTAFLLDFRWLTFEAGIKNTLVVEIDRIFVFSDKSERELRDIGSIQVHLNKTLVVVRVVFLVACGDDGLSNGL